MTIALRPALICLALVAAPAGSRADCTPRDFLAMPLPLSSDNIATALGLAYPGSRADTESARFASPAGSVIPWQGTRAITDQARLDSATIGDMFAQTCPLDLDPADRLLRWADPGRARNDALFRAFYGNSADQVAAHLTTVRYYGQTVTAEFQVTTRACVHVQLQAALDAPAALSPGVDPFLTDVGGISGWRVIAGTDRLSSHSFGAAIDLNAERGGQSVMRKSGIRFFSTITRRRSNQIRMLFLLNIILIWRRWSGAPEGDVGQWDTALPAALIATMGRYGFIWGGKWHHHDGKHFEYRPDLILFALLTGD